MAVRSIFRILEDSLRVTYPSCEIARDHRGVWPEAVSKLYYAGYSNSAKDHLSQLLIHSSSKIKEEYRMKIF